MLQDGCEVRVWHDNLESLNKALRLLKKQVGISGVPRLLKRRKNNASVQARKRDKVIRAKEVRSRNQQRMNTAGLNRGKRRK